MSRNWLLSAGLATACALAGLVGLSGCAGAGVEARPPATAAGSTPELPVLRVGTSNDYAPFSRAGEGFDVEVARLMAADLGYRVQWVPFTWPQLAAAVAADAFDVGMSGITWKADRSVVGWMTRAVGVGGPCTLGVGDGEGPVAVNRGGILERWARAKYPPERIVTVDDNLALPELLASGRVQTIVTDRFEVVHFAREGWRRECEPPRDRKVYWVAPARAGTLGPRIDAWLAENEARIDTLRARHFGAAAPWTAVDHLVDLLARRLALMPAVAAHKRARGLPIEDREREAVVLEQTLAAAGERGLERASVEALFRAQIELAKAVQRHAPADAQALDLQTVLRPALSALGPRILDALVAAAGALPTLRAEQLDLLVPLLDDAERTRLLAALRAVRLAPPASPAPTSASPAR